MKEKPEPEPDWIKCSEAVKKANVQTRHALSPYLIEDGEHIKGRIRVKKIHAKQLVYHRQDCEDFKNRFN